MTASLRIAIVGHGIAGIAAAIQLRRLDHRIDHFESHSRMRSGGGGLLLQPPALELLRELGLGLEDLPLGTRITGFAAEDLGGRTLTRLRYADHRPDSHGLGIQRRYLIERLCDQDQGREQVHFAHAAMSADTQRGIVRMSDGREYGPYDLIIAADGANSSLRNGQPRLVRRDQLYASAALVACIDDPAGLAGDELIQYFDGAQHVAAWAVGAARDDEPPRVNLSLNVPLQQADSLRASGAWKHVVARHCPRLAPLLDRLDEDFAPIIYAYRDVGLHRMVSGKLVFIGDAAHSMSPLLGQGARMALLDARTLAQSLRAHADLPTALHAFDRIARAKADEFQRISRWLTPIFQSESSLLAAVRHSVQLAHRLPFVATRIRTLLMGEGSQAP